MGGPIGWADREKVTKNLIRFVPEIPLALMSKLHCASVVLPLREMPLHQPAGL